MTAKMKQTWAHTFDESLLCCIEVVWTYWKLQGVVCRAPQCPQSDMRKIPETDTRSPLWTWPQPSSSLHSSINAGLPFPGMTSPLRYIWYVHVNNTEPFPFLMVGGKRSEEDNLLWHLKIMWNSNFRVHKVLVAYSVKKYCSRLLLCKVAGLSS